MSKKELYTDYLQRKHRMFFGYLDPLNTGRIVRKEKLKDVEEFSKVNVRNELEAAFTRYCFLAWQNVVFTSKNPEEYITEDGFIEKIRSFYDNDTTDEYYTTIEGIYNVIFDRLDTDRDGNISRDELKVYYQAFSLPDEDFIDRVFRKLDDNGDGLVVKHEFIKAGLEFWKNADPSSGYDVMYDIQRKTVIKQA